MARFDGGYNRYIRKINVFSYNGCVDYPVAGETVINGIKSHFLEVQ